MQEDGQVPEEREIVNDIVNDIDKRLTTHEAVCAERYNGLLGRLKRLETIMIGACGFIIVLLLSLVTKG